MISWWNNLDSTEKAAWAQAIGTTLAVVLGLIAFLRETWVRRADVLNRAACLIPDGTMSRGITGIWTAAVRNVGMQPFYSVQVLATRHVRLLNGDGEELPLSTVDWLLKADHSEPKADPPTGVLSPGGNASLATGLAVDGDSAYSAYSQAHAQITLQYMDVDSRLWVRTGLNPPKRQSPWRSWYVRRQSARQIRQFVEFARKQQLQKIDLALRQTDASKVRAAYWYERDFTSKNFTPRVQVTNGSEYSVTNVRVRTSHDFRMDPPTNPLPAEIWFRCGLYDWVASGGGQAQVVNQLYSRPKDRAVDEYSRDDARAWDIAMLSSQEVYKFKPSSSIPCH